MEYQLRSVAVAFLVLLPKLEALVGYQSEMCEIADSVVDRNVQRHFQHSRVNMPSTHLETAVATAGANFDVASEVYGRLCPANYQRRSCSRLQCGLPLANFLPGWRCNCDAQCVKYGDCCHNVHTECAHIFAEGTNMIQKRQVSSNQADHSWSCQPEPTWNYDFHDSRGVFMVSQCPSGWLNAQGSGDGDGDSSNNADSEPQYDQDFREYISALCDADEYAFSDVESLLLKLPVLHKPSATLYKNYYCGLCHGLSRTSEQDISVWTAAAYCPLDIEQPNFNETSEEELLCFFTSRPRCRMVMVPSHAHGYSERKCKAHAISDCADANVSPSWLVEACAAYTSHVFTQGLLFKNAHCAMCNGVLLDNHEPYYKDMLSFIDSTTPSNGGRVYLPEELPITYWNYELNLRPQTILNLHDITCQLSSQ